MLRRMHRRCSTNPTGTTSEPAADLMEVGLKTVQHELKLWTHVQPYYFTVASAQRKRRKKARSVGNKTENKDIGNGRTDDERVPFFVASLEFWINAVSVVRCSTTFVCNLPNMGNNRSYMAGSRTMLISALLDLLFPFPNREDSSGSSYVPYAATKQRPPHSNRAATIRILRNIITTVRLQTTCII